MTAIDVATFSFSGELCDDNLDALRETLHAINEPTVVLDLRNVTIFSAAAIGLVARVRARGIDVRLVNPSPLTAMVLEAVGLDAIVL